MAFAFLWLCLSDVGSATKREDLERAAELAVERAAERAAERAVEKALESGNSTTETETIRESYSSVRKSDKSLRLPSTGYTPAQRHEYDRIIREQEAAERASAFVKRSVDNRRDARQLPVGNSDQGSPSVYHQQPNHHQQQHQQQQSYTKNLPENASPIPGPFAVTRQLPVPVGGYESSYATVARDQEHHRQQRLPAGRVYEVRDADQFASLYPVKVLSYQPTGPYPLQLFRVVPAAVSPVPIATPTSPVTYRRSIDDRSARLTDTGDYPLVRDYGSRPGQSWIFR